MSFVHRRSAAAENAPSFDSSIGVSVALGGSNQIVASQVLEATPEGVRARPQLVAADDGTIHLGMLTRDRDVVVLVWTKSPVASAGRLDVSLRQRNRPIANAHLTAHVAANVPRELGGAESVYVLRIGAGDDTLTHSTPPADAIVSLESVVAWLG
jgi:hypothetical protein